jgi:hypothetical protein
MKGKDGTGSDVAENDFQTLREALRRMPTPEPRPGFVERALARAAEQQQTPQAVALPGRLRSLATRWETWAGAAVPSLPRSCSCCCGPSTRLTRGNRSH